MERPSKKQRPIGMLCALLDVLNVLLLQQCLPSECQQHPLHPQVYKSNSALTMTESRACLSASAAGPAFELTGRVKGQATTKLLGAYASAQYPADIVVTDGHTWHVLRVRGGAVISMKMTTTQALQHPADFLKQVCRWYSLVSFLE